MSEQMKLSEAIREGAKLRPQARGAYGVMTEAGFCSCALGAAYEASKGMLVEVDNRDIGNYLRYVFPLKDTCVNSEKTLEENIIFQNDSQRKTREQIADWLEEKGY